MCCDSAAEVGSLLQSTNYVFSKIELSLSKAHLINTVTLTDMVTNFTSLNYN